MSDYEEEITIEEPFEEVVEQVYTKVVAQSSEPSEMLDICINRASKRQVDVPLVEAALIKIRDNLPIIKTGGSMEITIGGPGLITKYSVSRSNLDDLFDIFFSKGNMTWDEIMKQPKLMANITKFMVNNNIQEKKVDNTPLILGIFAIIGIRIGAAFGFLILNYLIITVIFAIYYRSIKKGFGWPYYVFIMIQNKLSKSDEVSKQAEITIPVEEIPEPTKEIPSPIEEEI